MYYGYLFVSGVYMLVLAFGVPANIFCAAFLCWTSDLRLRNAMGTMTVCLALADLLSLLLSLPLFLHSYGREIPLLADERYACKTAWFLRRSCLVIGVYACVLLALARTVGLVRPKLLRSLHRQHLDVFVVVMTVLVVLCVNVPSFFYAEPLPVRPVEWMGPPWNASRLLCFEYDTKPPLMSLVNFVMGFAIPLVLLFVLSLVCVYYIEKARLADYFFYVRQQLTVPMVVLPAVAFPLIYSIHFVLDLTDWLAFVPTEQLRMISYMVILVGNAVDPFVYCLMSPDFRNSVKQVLCSRPDATD